jgi:outer membrane protein assembly factor BamB
MGLAFWPRGVFVNAGRGAAAWIVFAASCALSGADDWPRFRGRDGSAVSEEAPLPSNWSKDKNVQWSIEVPGEGSSSPIVCGDRIILTTALEGGAKRAILCFDRHSGRSLWTCEVEDDWPEITSALTGYAAATPATDGKHVLAFFGSAGAVCCDLDGRLVWRKDLGDFETELGIASSPVIHKETAILVCDHDGDRFNSFDSYLIALDLKTGQTRWKTERPGLHRSWSTPIVVPGGDGKSELIVAGENELRGYDPVSGAQLWSVSGLTSWVAPSPVFGHGLIFVASGKDGPTMAVRPGGRGDVTETHVLWSERRGAPYVGSPLLYRGQLYTATEGGVVTCRDPRTGEVAWQRRLEGRFFASPSAGDGKIYLAADSGKMFVLAAGDDFELTAENDLGEEILASPVLVDGAIFLRMRRRLYCIGED